MRRKSLPEYDQCMNGCFGFMNGVISIEWQEQIGMAGRNKKNIRIRGCFLLICFS